MMFNTTHGNNAIDGIPDKVEEALGLVPAAARFDSLLALTYAINQYDHWLYDNESQAVGEEGDTNDVEAAVKKLAHAWRLVLACSDDALGIDPEFTRPGTEALLEDFARKLSDVEDELYEYDVDLSFEWKPSDPELVAAAAAAAAAEEEEEEEEAITHDDDDDDDDDDDEGVRIRRLVDMVTRNHERAELTHLARLDETCQLCGAREIFVTRRGDDVVTTKKVLLTPDRKLACKAAETFVMGGIGISVDAPTGDFVSHHAENSDNVCRQLCEAARCALAKLTPGEKFDHLFALTRQLNEPHSDSGSVNLTTMRFTPPNSPGEWMTETSLWREGEAMETGVAGLAAAWRELFVEHTNEQLCVDEAFSRPGVEAMLDEFKKKLNACAAMRDRDPRMAYPFEWRPPNDEEEE